jgi:glycosyltransferase involved in cell wall biosynthesis
VKILHVFNRHRGGGGADNACDATIKISKAAGLDVACFERDSRNLKPGIGGKVTAFASGIYARDAVRDFAETLRRKRPDVVHTHELYPLISPWILRVCTERNIPVVHACYDFRLTCPIATHVRDGRVCTDCLHRGEVAAVLNDCRDNLAESAAYALRNRVARAAGLFHRHVSRFIVLTEFSRGWLMQNAGIDCARIAVNAPAVEASSDPVDAAQGGYIAYAGRFVPEKGVDVLVAAARKLGLPVKLAGNASDYPGLLPTDPISCELTPARDDLIRFYRGARMLVVPSLWFETFALVAAEAMGQGVPVVASRTGALQDTVQDGLTGLHFTPGNAKELASVIQRLWDDPALTRTLGARGHRRVTDEFSGERHMRGLISIYESVVGDTRRKAA